MHLVGGDSFSSHDPPFGDGPWVRVRVDGCRAPSFIDCGGYVWVVIRRFGDPVLRHVCRSLGTRTPMSRIDRPRTRRRAGANRAPVDERAHRRAVVRALARSRGDVALGVVLAFDVVDVALDVARGVDGR